MGRLGWGYSVQELASTWHCSDWCLVVLRASVGQETKEQASSVSHLGVECIFREVCDLFFKARKKLFYLLIHNFRAETKHLQLKVIRDLVSRQRRELGLRNISRKEAEVFSSQSSVLSPKLRKKRGQGRTLP